ncbi:hypothetical protein HNP55_002354 [Paucibacter oligotrophus]|uniref:Uncharacterized protein n=1 Tax=Roseateles oligotrophus TaxID=1769250 RepID=A0A840L7U3_9BURK|nr:hypothetical protein [Roseateles oligotrophus]MBB4843831.1 hypothetical protein [Roseateles oligotrophus]
MQSISPSSNLALLNAGKPGRSPGGTAPLAASNRLRRLCGPAWDGPALGPQYLKDRC